MTREEIIEQLNLTIGLIKQDGKDWLDDRDIPMLEECVKALSQEPTEKPMTVDEMEREYEKSKALFHKIVECEDAISRDAVIDATHHCGDLQEVRGVVQQLPPVMQKSGKWIPVSEPPKKLGTYLIQTDGEPYICQCRWTDVNPFWTDFKTKPHWNIFDLPQYSKAVAWMPLPKPYEPQESEDV